VSAASPVTVVDADADADDDPEPEPEPEPDDEDDDEPVLVPLDDGPVEPLIGATADELALAEACDEVDVW